MLINLEFPDNHLLLSTLFCVYIWKMFGITLQCNNIHHSKQTLMHCSAKSLLFLEAISTTISLLHRALMAPSTQTMRRVHSAETSR